MSQQLGIILMIDVDAAINANTLEGHTYLFDNMKLQGSEGLGTGKLVSAINGTHFSDGSQANEQVLNWLPYAMGSLPPTIPKSFLAEQSRQSDLKALEDLKGLADRIENTEKAKFNNTAAILEELKKITGDTGMKTKTKSKRQDKKRELGRAGQKIMDVTGQLVSIESENEIPELYALNPVITDITGEAVDKNVIYPAAYGSPDTVTDGWYWAASVDSTQTGTYAYTMHIQLYKLALDDGEWTWVPVDMTYDAYLKISDDAKINGFTGAGVGMLPIV